MEKQVIVIGAGAAGLMAAYVASRQGKSVIVLEKTNQTGKKIRISGKGRCNITNAAPIPELIENYPGNGRFLYGALNRFSNKDLIDLLGDLGVETKVERGNRVFPVSDDANQIAGALEKAVRESGAQVLYNRRIAAILVEQQAVVGVSDEHGRVYHGNRVILATGGASYPGTGSTGDGYKLAKAVGHSIVPIFPSLVPLKTKESWVKDVAGLSLRNVELRIIGGASSKRVFGEMVFTHLGISGPIVLTLSREIAKQLQESKKDIKAEIDLKPALGEEQLDERIQRDFHKYIRKQFNNGLDDLLPKSLIPIIIQLSGIESTKPIHQISRDERKRLVDLIKHLPLTITDTFPLATAIVTAGGVDVKEVNPKTMESKLVPGLFLAGEVLDIDGLTGGFNLQAAFSTGFLAGKTAVQGEG